MKKAFANNLGFGGTMAWSVDFNAGVSDNPPVSTDGSCGPANGGTACEGSGFSDCCSANGWCGSALAHCGSGCLGGKCIQGAVTTDGSCGAGANNAICGDWPAGDCCSPAGWCGSTPDHCGVGCQSGSCIDRDNVVFVDPRCPPVPLESTTTFTITPFTTSLEVGSSVGGTFAVTTTTVTVVVQDIVTHVLPQSNVVITNGQTAARFNPTPSIVIPPSTVTFTNGLGQTSTRLVVFPPWPQDDAWNIGAGPFISESSTSPSNGTSLARLTLPPMTWMEEPYTEPPLVLPCTANYGQYYISEHDAFVTISECPVGAATSIVSNCLPTKTVAIEADTTKSFSLGCTLFTGTGSRITSGPLPTYTAWPDGELILEEEGDDDDSGDEFKLGCDLWFFNICWPDAKLGGLRWKFPEGALPPGPPPFIRWPKNITPMGTLPGPWPPITIPWDRKPIIPTSKAGQCTTRTADICSTTTTLDITIDGTSTKTSARTQSTCTTIRGCKVEDDDWETTTTTSCAQSTITTDLITGGNKVRAELTVSPEVDTNNVKFNRRQDDSPGCSVTSAGDVMIFPKNPTNAAAHVALRNYLMSNPEPAVNFWEARGGRGTVVFSASNSDGSEPFYGLYLVHGLDRRHYDEMWNRRDILGIAHMFSIQDRNLMILPPVSPHARRSETARDKRNTNTPLMARDKGTREKYRNEFWELSIMVVPPMQAWEVGLPYGMYGYEAYDSFGESQVIYVVEEGLWTGHEEFDGALIDKSSIQVPYLGDHHVVDPDLTHGTQVAAKLVGKNLGLARKAQLILSPIPPMKAPADRLDTIHEGILISLIGVLNHVMRHPGERGKQIAEYDMIHRVLKKLESLDIVVVVSTHNEDLEPDVKNSVDDLFMRWANPRDSGYIEGLIAVSGINQNTWISPLNPWAPWIALAPGYNVDTSAEPPSTESLLEGMLDDSSARAASLRTPVNVKKLVFHMHQPVSFLPDENGISAIINIDLDDDEPAGETEWAAYDPRRTWNRRMPFLWSGEMNGAGNCVPEPWLHGCPEGLMDDDLSKLEHFGSDSDSCAAPGSVSLKEKRQAAAVPYCSVVLNPQHQPSGPRATSALTYTPDPASPTCLSSCGTYCSGFYCRNNPTGHPPAFFDPGDPAHQPTTTSPGRAPTPPPELPPLPPGPTCSGNQYPTTTMVCNGAGGNLACLGSLICATSMISHPDPGSPPAADRLPGHPGIRPRELPTRGQIRRFANGHIPKASSGVTCPDVGERIAVSEVDNGETLNGCHKGGYTDGYQVCEVEGGAHIYRPDGKWMLCERDNSILRHCYLLRWQTYTRHMKCDGIWRT
ncbi:Lectin [Madurella mycetomatis]|uniref:Lectin n=1 Tax=Madurella mycetomatis TaxID=100816 RepID=A0A175VXG5_9PEZI|nr:Lectin [Madurella mycetomatis]